MRFTLLLKFIAFKFKKVSSTNKNFQKFLLGNECRIVIKTKDGKKGQRFVFNDGKFSSDKVLDQYDAAMIWTDASTAFNAMRKGEEGITDGLQNHKVGIEGHMHSFQWFASALAFVME
jgi:hypothetical protein